MLSRALLSRSERREGGWSEEMNRGEEKKIKQTVATAAAAAAADARESESYRDTVKRIIYHLVLLPSLPPHPPTPYPLFSGGEIGR